MLVHTENEKKDVLLCSRFSKYLSGEDKELFERNIEIVYFNRGEVIFREGTPLTHFIWIEDGIVKIYYRNQNGKDILVTLRKGLEFMNLLSLADHHFNYSSNALTSAKVCYVEKNLMNDLMLRNPDFAIYLFKESSRQSVSLLRQVISRSNKHVTGRVAELILFFYSFLEVRDGYFELPLTRKEFAQLASTSKENLIRTLSEFKKDGIIDLNLRRIKINSMEIIEKLSRLG
ncbi:Crp/Fnr family transcriptional regulator [Thermophagus sp. OGC60D27]|uniref:Crp/Fnr family transcriptional regulator n=1 Tax=Thermophagus sp. OGC60D27 TaxID=3458415 RepID=UPI004037F485